MNEIERDFRDCFYYQRGKCIKNVKPHKPCEKACSYFDAIIPNPQLGVSKNVVVCCQGTEKFERLSRLYEVLGLLNTFPAQKIFYKFVELLSAQEKAQCTTDFLEYLKDQLKR